MKGQKERMGIKMRKKQIAAFMAAGALLAQTVLLGACADAGTAETAGSTAAQTMQQKEDSVQTAEETAQPETTQAPLEEVSSETGETGRQQEDQDGVNGFSFRLTQALLEEKEAGENLVASPYSVWLPLAALSNAAEDEANEALFKALGEAGISCGELNDTAAALQNALLGKDLAADAEANGGTYESPVKIANALFIGEGVQPKEEFQTAFENSYDGKLFSVDFSDPSAIEEVNGWAAEQTDGKITELVESFDPATVAAIANALYFSDSWATPFPTQNTQAGTFNGAVFEEEAQLMHQKFTQATYYEDETMQAVLLPTMSGGQMIILLPVEGTAPEELLAGMDAQKLEEIMAADFATVELTLPRFDLASPVFSVKEAMEALGITLTDGMDPHLTGLVEGEALYISDAVQKATVEVDENGLTASAATVMGIERMSMPMETQPVEMICDRPFAFVLTADGREAGQQVLFTGVVNQLSQAVECK